MSVDEADDAADHIEDADRDVSRGLRWYARAYIVALIAIAIAAAGTFVYTGHIQFAIDATVDPNLTAEVELLSRGLVYIFLGFTALMAIVAVPSSLLSDLIRGLARLMDAYELPNTDDEDDDA